MTKINRNKLIAEELIRTHIRKKVSEKIATKRLAETKIRKVIRKLLETATGADEASKSTGINVLASLLEKIVPILEDDYKMLTTSDQQRESFKNHIVQAVKNALRPIESQDDAEDRVSENTVFEVDASLLGEKLKIDLDGDEEESVEGEFIDIDAGEEEEDTFGSELDGQNETGRNFAAASFKKVENQIVDAYDMLADDEDKEIFYDYLLTNLLLYFDKFEDELQPESVNTTTPEYEEEVAAEEEETDASVDLEEPADAETVEL